MYTCTSKYPGLWWWRKWNLSHHKWASRATVQVISKVMDTKRHQPPAQTDHVHDFHHGKTMEIHTSVVSMSNVSKLYWAWFFVKEKKSEFSLTKICVAELPIRDFDWRLPGNNGGDTCSARWHGENPAIVGCPGTEVLGSRIRISGLRHPNIRHF